MLAQHYAAWPAQLASPAHLAPSSVVFLPDKRTGACPTRAPPRRATSSLPACLSSPSSLWMIPRDATHAPYPSHSSPDPLLSSSSLSLSLTAERHRCHRSPLPRPLPPPRPSVVSTSSATTPSSSPPSCASPDAPWCRRRRLHHLRPPQIAIAASSSPARPRPQRAALQVRREPCFLLPSLPWPRSPSSCRLHHGRTFAAVELAVDAAPVTIWSPRRVQQARKAP